jgi:hypothetical protein
VTARVFVPLIGANGEGARLFEAIADATPPPAHPARLIPQISELFDFGLYSVGQVVREAVMRFVAARRTRLWLDRRNGSEAPWNLRISDSQIGRLSDENSRSAGLALAIAALCQAFRRDSAVIFATGEIVLPSAPGALAVTVGAVGGVRAKLALIGDYLVQHRTLLEGKRIVVALPSAGLDGRPLAQSEASTLARLASEAKGIGAKFEIAYLSSLDDLDEPLGPFVIEEMVTPRRAFIGIAALAALAAAAFALQWLSRAPIALAFEPAAAELAASADAAAPRRARYDSASDKITPFEPCFNGQREPLVVGGETLIFRVRARDDWPLVGRWRPPRLFVVSVSRAADPVVLDAARFKTIGPANAASANGLVAAIPIEAVEDEVRLFVVATRDPALDAMRLQNELRAALQGLSGPAVLATAASFLTDRLGNVTDYQFKVTNDASACPA